jgi:ABC-2 type transport system ATP-binding protein
MAEPEKEGIEEDFQVEVSGLTKYYRDIPAIRDVDFSLKKGEVVGFLGPNGAGKSTTMRILVGAIPATRGTARICGYDVFESPLQVKSRIGYLPKTPPVYTDLTVMEQLRLGASLKGLSGTACDQSIEQNIERLGLQEMRHRLVGNLSKGFRQRVGFAQALLGDPEVLILDEPTVGLDPKQIQEVRRVIAELGGQHTIILSTHILQEVTMTCQRVMMIRRGEIVLDENLDTLAEKSQGQSLEEIFLSKVDA